VLEAPGADKPGTSSGPAGSDPAEGAGAGHAALAGAVRAVSGVTLISRLAGLAREVLVARVFGATAIGSAFMAGFAIPNMFRRLFGEGALAAAFIPEYTRAHKADPGAADAFASFTAVALLLVTTGVMVVGELGLLAALLMLPHNPDRALSIELIMVMLPFMPLVCAAAILGGMLQVHGRFGPAASGPIILNGFVVATGLYFLARGQQGGAATAYVLGVATVLSGATQCLWFLRLLRPYVRWSRGMAGAEPRARAMMARFVPAAIGMGTLQINALLDTLIAMWPIWVGPALLGFAYPLDEGSNIILASAQRLYQFPLGVFGIAVATAVFPLLSRHADEPGSFLQTLRRGLRLSLFIGLPASVGLIVVRGELTAMLYGFGRAGFAPEDVKRSAAALAGFAPGVWAYSLNHVLTRAFYARGDTRTPMRVALGMVGLNLCLNLALIWPLREAGLAWATSISAAVQCAILATVLARRLGERVLDRETLRSFAGVVLAAGMMAVIVLGVRAGVSLPRTWAGAAVGVGLTAGAGVVGYLAAARVLRLHEMRWLLKRGS
jgi:putative peptidoglycan lipid II flippase